jgi:hypothetical protein
MRGNLINLRSYKASKFKPSRLVTVPPRDVKALLGFSYADITPIKPAILINFIGQINGKEIYYLFVFY